MFVFFLFYGLLLFAITGNWMFFILGIVFALLLGGDD
jgi:hypothetical protein